MEALKWFKGNKNRYGCFAGNAFDNKKQAVGFVNKLYKLGAKKVEVDNIYDEEWRIKEEGGEYADQLIIELPSSLSKRIDLLDEISQRRPDEITSRSGTMKKVNWKKDKKVYLWWD